jgi:geranylgeranyl transferase type-1 subunit beta
VKNINNSTDVYHSYLGLATLALMKEPGLKEVDPVLPGVSLEAKMRLEKSIDEILIPEHYFWKAGKGQFSSKASVNHEKKPIEAEEPPKYLVNLLQHIGESADSVTA